MRRGRRLTLGVALVWAVATLGLPAGQAATAGASASIDGALLVALEDGGTANFFVQMTAQADLSAAYGMDWQARGEYVWRALQEVARAAQAPVLDLCRERRQACRSFAIGDLVYVRGANLETAQDLAALPGVAGLWLERVLPLPELVRAEGQTAWGLVDIGATDVWAAGFRGEGVVVANIDTGVQWDHPALIGGYRCAEPGDPRCWYDPANVCGGAPCDNNGHGTHVMGTMVARDNPEFPYTVGVAPSASWIACKGCEDYGCTEFSLTACAEWLLAPGDDPGSRPNAVNNSWGGGGGDPWFQVYVQAWRAAGIFASAAAGGSGPGCGGLGSPCDYPEMFCTTAHDENRIIGSFASRGPGSFGHDPYTKPNISAPGMNICSTIPPNAWTCGYSGSSMASPHSVGAVALVYSACPALVGKVVETFAVLQDNADMPPGGNCGAPPDGAGNYTYGYGYLNVGSAVEACLESVMHVGNIKLRSKVRAGQYAVLGVAPVLDQAGAPVAGATVSAEWQLPNGRLVPMQGTSLANGLAKFQIKRPQVGLYQLCVTGIVKAGSVYDPDQNVETCETLAVP